MSIAAVLIPELQRRFPGRGLRIAPKPGRYAVFPAAHPLVGDIAIDEDGDDLIVYLGHFTHAHLGNNDEGLRGAERATAIVANLMELLQAVFADRVVMWGSHNGGGGFCAKEEGWDLGVVEAVPERLEESAQVFVWSGPVG
jgi:hypothetical protein